MDELTQKALYSIMKFNQVERSVLKNQSTDEDQKDMWCIFDSQTQKKHKRYETE